MKLRNKKTGEIADVEIQVNCMLVTHQDGRIEQYYFDSIRDLLEWEDMPEEPKDGYIIDPMEEDYVSADDSGYEESDVERAKELGIWLETKEEAEKAVEKLRAWKRLRDKGFRFDLSPALGHCDDKEFDISIIGTMPAKWWYNDKVVDDIHYIFGGEE